MQIQTSEFIVGLLLRREFRRVLRSRGLSYTEDKGWLDSQFIVHAPGSELIRLQQMVQRVNAGLA